MAKIIGALVNMGLKKEASYGTDPGAAPTFTIPWVSFSFDDKASFVFSAEALGNIDDTHESKVTEKYAEGDMEGEVRVNPFGLLLLQMMGTVSSAVTEAGTVYTHSYSLLNSNQHPSSCLYIDEPNGDYKFVGTMLNSLEVKMTLNNYVTFKAGFMARPSMDTVISMPALSNDNKFICTHVTVKFAADVASLGAASETKCQEVTLTIEKNLMRKMVLGTIVPNEIINQLFSVTGQIKLPFESHAIKTSCLNGTSQAMQIDLYDANTTIGAASHPRLTFTMPNITLYDWTPNRPKGELYEQTFAFKAKRDEANDLSSISTLSLVNTNASY